VRPCTKFQDRLPNAIESSLAERANPIHLKRYDQRDRLVRQRTETVNRLRSAALRLDRGDLPGELVSATALAAVTLIIASAESSGDAVVLAFVDDLRFAVEDIVRINSRIKTLEALLGPMVRRLAPELLELRGVIAMPHVPQTPGIVEGVLLHEEPPRLSPVHS